MALPKYPQRQLPPGGFNRPIKAGIFIRNALAGGGMIYAKKLHTEYVAEVRRYPYQAANKKGVRRTAMSYGSFRVYLYMARQLNLIEYCNPDGSVPVGTVQDEPVDMPGLSGRLYFRMVPGQEGNPDWNDLTTAYKENKGK